MPSIEENKRLWERDYDWHQGGSEWSQWWGSVDMQWFCCLLPRIHCLIPCKRILEIGPGFGRWTEFLKDYCDSLDVSDLSEKCIEACKKRFSPYFSPGLGANAK